MATNGRPISFAFDPSDPLATWTEVVSLSYGTSIDDLGSLSCFDCEAVRPEAFAVDDAGVIWVADTLNRRIARYGTDGRYLGQTPLPEAREVRSLEPTDDGVVAVFNDCDVVQIDSHGRVVARSRVRLRGRCRYLYDLYRAEDRLFAFSFGGLTGQGGVGAAEIVDIKHGTMSSADGLPFGEADAWVDLLGHGRDRWYRLTITDPTGAVTYHRFIVSSVRAPNKVALADVNLVGVAPGRPIVDVEPLAPSAYDPVDVGTWLVSVASNGRILGNVRTLSQEPSRLPQAMDATGTVYRMRDAEGGIVIERLPRSALDG